ncbi:recombination regulator RecX [Planococcus sp. CP5-4]|uniref:recombination regulator RecX n=1 Tax=unclassified Planococcus (in: firmicutes) TaxID=2662419 RepID=UPI001C21E54C|nr:MULTISPECIES: recombination regulator RecX [unclassified Planococcus (in: firmicutes)]MBU9674992.1 recombination regulator RecX [Planococcus sp. CP5-4_YE]MBV0910652.1 recombination regulator RecX [Planococcus sp. CP5-4_UN]MBW6065418.1 recombination regulator RecX [Planococcus sp. CP5-4]
MPIITKITRGKNNPERYNIYLEEKFAFSVDETLIIRYQLTKGKELDQWTIEEMNFEDEVRKAFNKALHYLGFRMRSEGEVRKKLKEKEFGEAVIDEAVKKLYELSFLDDQQFSEALLRTQIKSGKKGPRAIQQDMQKRGIDKAMQKDVLTNYSEEEQLEVATGLAEKIAAKEQSKTPSQVKQKINDSLMRKGYPYGIIKQAIETLDLERDGDQWLDSVRQQGDKLWRKHESKMSGNDLSRKVKQGLYQKGFPGDVISQYIEEKELEDE